MKNQALDFKSKIQNTVRFAIYVALIIILLIFFDKVGKSWSIDVLVGFCLSELVIQAINQILPFMKVNTEQRKKTFFIYLIIWIIFSIGLALTSPSLLIYFWLDFLARNFVQNKRESPQLTEEKTA